MNNKSEEGERKTQWEYLRFIVFDVPLHSLPFESRYMSVVSLGPSFPHNIIVSIFYVENRYCYIFYINR